MSEFKQEISPLAKEIGDYVYQKIAVEFAHFMENIEKGQKGTIESHEIKINQLRTDFETNKMELEVIAKHKPTLETIQGAIKFWSWRKHWLRIILIALGIIFLFSAIVIGIYSFMRKSGWVTYELSNKTTENKEQYDFEMRIKNAPTRGTKKIRYTDAQKDSIHTDNQLHMQRVVDERNAEYKKLSETWKAKK